MKFTHSVGAIAISVSILLSLTPAVEASEDVAIIEGLTSERADIQVFDILGSGRTFRLKPDEVLTLVYLNNCLQEIITGGVVTIGINKSRTVGSKIKSLPYDCESEIKTASD